MILEELNGGRDTWVPRAGEIVYVFQDPFSECFGDMNSIGRTVWENFYLGVGLTELGFDIPLDRDEVGFQDCFRSLGGQVRVVLTRHSIGLSIFRTGVVNDRELEPSEEQQGPSGLSGIQPLGCAEVL